MYFKPNDKFDLRINSDEILAPFRSKADVKIIIGKNPIGELKMNDQIHIIRISLIVHFYFSDKGKARVIYVWFIRFDDGIALAF